MTCSNCIGDPEIPRAGARWYLLSAIGGLERRKKEERGSEKQNNGERMKEALGEREAQDSKRAKIRRKRQGR